MIERVPELFTAHYRAEKILTNKSGDVVPLWASFRKPIVELSYRWVRAPESLLPESWMLFEWPYLCHSYWRRLDELGVEKIAGELAKISEEHGALPLVLVDYEDLQRGDRSHRIIFSRWWEEKTGRPVPELTNDGEELHYSQLHRRVQPKKPKDPTQDHRYRQEAPLDWPLSHEDVARWIEGRHWQQARSRTNPHSYTVRAWGDPTNFERIVLHLREHGEQEIFAKDLYTYYVVDGYKYWSMGAALSSTVVLNRKRLGQDVGDQRQGAEPGLFDAKEEA